MPAPTPKMGKRFSWLLPNRGMGAGSLQSTDTALAPEILSAWESKVQQWSQDGSLLAAAQEALMLPGEPQALKDLIAQWSLGVFDEIPEIVLLSGADMNGALGAYALSTGKIYLNQDWLKTATQEAIDAVLTEELGHHLDGLVNAVDTPGDEGEYFSDLLNGKGISKQEISRIRQENDQISLTLSNGNVVTAEASLINGTEGDDNLKGDGFSNEIYGYGGNDTINGEAGADLIDGGDGNDIIDGSFGNDTLYGGAGDDNLTDSQGANLLDGGDGNDTLTSQALTGNHALFGGIGNDSLYGTGQTINLDGGAGQDFLNANGELYQNNTSTYVQRGRATLIGGDGDDSLSSQILENALLQGNDGNDSLFVGCVKNSTLEGGTGNDTLGLSVYYYYSIYQIGAGYGGSHRLDGGSGDDSLDVSGGGSYYWGRTDLVLDGGSGNDTLQVSDSAFTSNNGAFATASLAGGDGDDTLTASAVLQLTLSGGTGRDRFVLTALQYKATQASYTFYTDSNGNSTTVAGKPIEITDFQAGFGGDILDLKDLLQNGATGFDGSNPFGASGYLRLIQSSDNPADTWLQFDIDGGANNFITLAVLRNLKATDVVAENFYPAFSITGEEVAGQLIYGTPDADTLRGTAGADSIYGYGSNDTINGEAGADLIDGGDGNDTIDGSFGNDTLYGAAGDDNLTDSQGANLLDGGDGNDSLTSKALTGNHALFGGIGNDSLYGTGQTINLDGGAGQDFLNANGELYQNNTSTYVQRGRATLIGGDGDDSLSSQILENALLQGNDGNDSLFVGCVKNSTLEGGTGNDTLGLSVYYYYSIYQIGAGYGGSHRLDGGSGDDSLDVSGGGSYYWGRTDLVLDGGSGNDTLQVSDSAFTSNNGAFATASLAGGDGDDTLTASAVLQLTLSGGTGRDRFVLTALQYKATQASYTFYTDSNGNSTTVAGKPIEITDFQAGFGGDILDLKDLLQNGATGFDGSNPFGASGYLRLIQSSDNPADTWLQFDIDGGANNFITLAVLRNLKATDVVAENFYPAFSITGEEVAGQLIYGTPDADTLRGTAGADSIYGYGSNDTINGEAGADLIDGGDGNDTIDGSFGNDTLYGAAGDDNLTDSQGANLLDGGDGNDSLTSKALTGNHALFGGIGNDSLYGTGQTINLDGGAGQDFLNANGELYQNNTSTYVQRGRATLIGGDGDDSLSSQILENALLQGNDGNDSLFVGCVKNSTLEGGTGNDTLGLSVYYYYSIYQIGAGYGGSHRLDGGSGDDSLDVSGGGSYYWGRTDLVLDGGSGNDTLQVSDSAFTSNNGAFATASLAGGDGDDTLTASAVLQLTLSGGTGRDRFVLTALQYKATQASYTFYTDSNGNSTTVAGKPIEITDFQAGFGGDLLDLKDLLQNGATNYDGTNPFQTGHINLEQSGLDTLLKFDVDGGANSFITLAILRNVALKDLVAINISPLFGTPNDDVMVGLMGGTPYQGIGGNDIMLGIQVNPDQLSNINALLPDLISTATRVTSDLNLDGGSGNDTVVSGSGTDFLVGASGNDFVDGGAGNDTMSGGTGNDVLTGAAGNDSVNGDAGADLIIGGTGLGDDTYNGGDDIDTVKYTSAVNFSITVDLSLDQQSGTAKGDATEIGSDALINIENVIGGNAAAGDFIYGSNSANDLQGCAGGDLIDGRGGDDRLTGGTDNDTIIGGDGSDTAVFSGNRSDYSISFDQATSKYTVVDKTAARDGIDTVSQVEFLAFQDQVLSLQNGPAGVITTPGGTVPVVNDGQATFTISGASAPNAPVVGNILTATNSTADPDGNGVFTYAWQTSSDGSTWTAVGTNASSYTVAPADEGKQIRLVVSYTDAQNFSESVTTTAGTVPFVNNGQAVFSITGASTANAPVVGNILIATNTAPDPDGNGTFAYTWQTSPNGTTWTAVGTNSSSYTVAPADEGKQIRLVVSYTDGQGFSETITTTAGTVPFVNNGQAVFSITGASTANAPVVGNILTATNSTADPDGNGVFTYSWQTSPNGTTWTAVGTNASSYTVAPADEGKQIRLVVSYTDLQGFPESVTTTAGTVPNIPPTVSSFSPSDGSTAITVASNITLTFSELIQSGTGAIELRSGSATGALIESFDAATSKRLSIVGSTLTIDPTNDLASSTQYFLVIPSGAIKDTVGNAYAGTTTYDFTTAAPPTPIDSTPPTITGIAVTTNQILLQFSEALDQTNLPTIARFSVTVAGAVSTISAVAAVAGNATQLRLTIATAPTSAQTVTVAYTDLTTGNDTTGVVQDTSGNDMATITTALNATTFSTATTAATLAANYLNLILTGTTAINGTGNANANTITGNSAVNQITGGAGNDTMDGGASGDIYIIATSTDHTAAEIRDTGTTGTDELRFSSTTANQTLTVFAGDTGLEQVSIGTGTTTTATTSGTTALNINAALAPNGLTITGNNGANTLTGTAFADTINGNGGNDTLTGNAGDDILNGGAGNDTMNGGDGSDIYLITTNAEHTVAEIADNGIIGTDELRFSSTTANQTLTVFAGDTGLEQVSIGTGTTATATTSGTTALSINAALAPNALTITGNNGANTLTGTNFADILIGNGGNDTLNGGLGNDTLTGGAGADIYRFASALNGTTNVDRITDFSPTAVTTTTDRIQLENTGTGLFTAITATGTLATTAFISGAAFTNTTQRIRYESTTGNLFYDADGSGTASASILFATLNTGLAINNTHFVVT